MSGGPRGTNGGTPAAPPSGTPLSAASAHVLADGYVCLPSGAPGGVPPRAPGGVPPRRPGASGARAAAPGGRPPGSPGRSRRSRTRPADTRPPTAGAGPGTKPEPIAVPGTPPVTGPMPGPVSGPAAGPGTALTPARVANPATARTAGVPAPVVHRAARPAAAPLVPAQTPRRPVPQLRPTDHFAELLLGVLSGRRPVHSMLRHTVGRAYDDLAHLAERGPLRTRGASPVVRDLGYFEPRPGALEVFARIGAGDRLRALAFRLEQGRDLRWRCTAVEVGGPRRHRADDD
ncbi:Rv3235 family protein [Streptomyces coelicoflavus]|uniref:Rv3235 family protein n=1 Tax=Streptomyces coelicoflavus TaxID=285562 RepID=UPI0027E3A603|nr:Rv3235 family protein [Streptomyces coelicoflavus]